MGGYASPFLFLNFRADVYEFKKVVKAPLPLQNKTRFDFDYGILTF